MTSKEDLRELLTIQMQWHSQVDVVASLSEVLEIANRNKCKLSDTGVFKDMIRVPEDYDLSDDDVEALKINQSFT